MSAVASQLGYATLAGHYDEMLAPDGSVRPHWQPVADTLQEMGPAELMRRAQDAARITRENGMAYHVHQDASPGRDRPWPLDLIPIVLPAEEWSRIETAVSQRARLLNKVIADLYGPMRLVRDRLLPPELVYGHPGFLRPCHGMQPPNGVWLTVYAVDLARAPDGSWWVLGDRTEVPMGAGFALENRLVVSSVLPEAMNAAGARRLAPYFQTYRGTLANLATGHRENPRVAILTPGPAAEVYFEHAFLARYLGYSLVEGSDLTIRERRVLLKTLGGLLPVDLILRRQISEACDSLEFSNDAVEGTPGLVDAVRAGNISVANALGSGIAESPALMAFLPNLCRQLLGEDLLMPSVASWWCGDRGILDQVVDRLGELVLKRAFPGAEREVNFGAKLADDEKAALVEAIRLNPHRYVAQEQVALSTTPFRTKAGLSPRFLVVRAFAVSDGDSYTVMPGGLGRVSSSTGTLDVTVLRGGSSKDIWVLGQSNEPHVTLIPPSRLPVDVSRATFDLPSRVADNLFWLGRYAERVDAAVRLVRAALPLLSGESSRRSASALSGALEFLVELGYTKKPAEGGRKRSLEVVLERELRSIVSDSEQEGGLGWQVDHLHRIAWMLRDRLSDDTWRIINRLKLDFAVGREAVQAGRGLADLLDRMVIDLASFGGAVMEGMTRGHGWRMLDLGRRLERALQLLELLRFGLITVVDDERARIELLLETADSAITYRSRYLTSLQADLTIDLLLIDDANPRAAAFQLERLKEHIEKLPEAPSTVRRSPETRLVTGALAAVQLANLEELALVENGRRPGLEQLLDRTGDYLRELSETLSRDYLTHATPFRQLARG